MTTNDGTEPRRYVCLVTNQDLFHSALEWEVPEGKTKKGTHTLWGSFPELQMITDEEIEEAESIWNKHLEKTIDEI